MKATVNVSKEHIEGIIKDLDNSKYFLLDNSDTSRADLFNFALGLGLKDGHPIPLSTSVSFIRTSYIESLLYQYKSVFFDKNLSDHSTDIDEITDTDKALLLVEQYANRGFEILKKLRAEFEDDSHLMTKLLNEIDRDYKKFFENNTTDDEQMESRNNTPILASDEVSSNLKFTRYLPVYSIRAACGYFDGDDSDWPEVEGWVDASGCGIHLNGNMFVVYAKGNSMFPMINDGDLCVFESYSPTNAGSREGQIVLTEQNNRDNDYDCHYTIKKYHSEKDFLEDGSWMHTKITLIPLNKDYDSIELDGETSYRTIGVLRGIL